MEHLPPSVRACLWSYDVDKLDTERDKALIIRQVMNYGTYDAVAWLRHMYPEHELADTVRRSNANAWSPKSLNYWCTMLHVVPERVGRFS